MKVKRMFRHSRCSHLYPDRAVSIQTLEASELYLLTTFATNDDSSGGCDYQARLWRLRQVALLNESVLQSPVVVGSFGLQCSLLLQPSSLIILTPLGFGKLVQGDAHFPGNISLWVLAGLALLFLLLLRHCDLVSVPVTLAVVPSTRFSLSLSINSEQRVLKECQAADKQLYWSRGLPGLEPWEWIFEE